jgi:hypothetical protein
MINEVLLLLKDKLNSYFRLKANVPEDKVAFIDGSKMDPISFPIDHVIPLLINVGEERLLRPADRFEGLVRNGIKTQINPTINLSLSVLFVSRFADYEQSLKFLSLVVKFFQHNPVFDQTNTPGLNPNIDKLRSELITLPNAEQNSLWSSLRTTYTPSVLYKIGLLAFADDETLEIVGETRSIQTTIHPIGS